MKLVCSFTVYGTSVLWLTNEELDLLFVRRLVLPSFFLERTSTTNFDSHNRPNNERWLRNYRREYRYRSGAMHVLKPRMEENLGIQPWNIDTANSKPIRIYGAADSLKVSIVAVYLGSGIFMSNDYLEEGLIWGRKIIASHERCHFSPQLTSNGHPLS